MLKLKQEFKIVGDHVVIFVINKKGTTHEVLMDIEDAEKFAHYNVSLYVNDKGYVAFRTRIEGVRRHFYLHRWVMNAPKDMVVDHMEWNKLDNRKSKLRVCTTLENSRHKQSENEYRNVFWDKAKEHYYIQLKTPQGIIAGGKVFKDREEARKRAEELRALHYGEFAGEVVK
jgi:hypothetical protein